MKRRYLLMPFAFAVVGCVSVIVWFSEAWDEAVAACVEWMQGKP